jgi:hypothetical protein
MRVCAVCLASMPEPKSLAAAQNPKRHLQECTAHWHGPPMQHIHKCVTLAQILPCLCLLCTCMCVYMCVYICVYICV